MFGQYFVGDGIVNPPTTVYVAPYPQHQSVIVCAGFLPLPWVEHFWKKLKLLWMVVKIVFGHEFGRALDIVQDVAHTEGMNNGKAWGVVGQQAGKIAGVGENMFRHLLATQKWGPEVLGNRDLRDLSLQLAYVLYKKRRKV